jgi:cytochrome c-type biogenesis protein CcmE
VTGTLEPSAPADLGGEPPEGPARPRPQRRRVRLRLWVVGAVLVGALVFVLVEGLGSSLNYFDTVDQALAHKSSLGTTTFRLEGLVVPGTIRATAVGADFTVAEGGRQVPVHNTGTPPQLFGPNIPVVVVGHFGAADSDTFISDQVLVKHSANYIAGHPSRVTAPNGSVR